MSPKPPFNLAGLSNLEIHNCQVTLDEMTYIVLLLGTSIGMLLMQTRSVSFPELFINLVA